MPKSKRGETLDFVRAAEILETHWQAVTAETAARRDFHYVSDPELRAAIHSSLNHRQVAYRF